MMDMKNFRSLGLLIFLLSLMTLACSLPSLGTEESGGPPRNAAVVEVMANTTLQPWLETAVSAFNDSETKNAAGNLLFVTVQYVESGQAVTDLVAGDNTTLWIPEEVVWASVLAGQGVTGFQNDCVSVAQSPLVIGMWREAAEALGWPGLPLGWLDIGSLASDPSAWNYYSGGELGDAFRLGHTHPGLSASGVSTLLALVQSAQAQREAVSVSDIQQPIVQASVGAFESGVSWFSSSTDSLGATMQARGVSYLTAAVMYESTAVHYGQGQIVPVYPLEGTFMASFPACINQSVDSEAQENARIFREYLLTPVAQETAVANGLRPINSAVTIGAPLDQAHGVDLNQPAIVFAPPVVETLFEVQELWQTARKDVNMVMLLDVSGSMRGDKMESMRVAAVQFVQQMGDDDYISLIAFATEPAILIEHARIGESRQQVVSTIEGLLAAGDTTLFDAIGDGASVIAATQSVNATNVMVVLSDGQDTRSYRYRFDQGLVDAATAYGTTIFTIAYGGDADEQVLFTLASQGHGNYYQGDEASIAAIYEEMSAAFGGSVGVGR